MWSTTDLLWSIPLLSSSRFVSQNPCLCSLLYKYSFKFPLPLFPLTLVEYNSNSMPSKYKKFCTYSKACKNPCFVLFYLQLPNSLILLIMGSYFI